METSTRPKMFINLFLDIAHGENVPIKYVAGDLFVNEYGAEALAHGCNCLGVMGAGIAVGFKTRYPQMYVEYRKRCLTSPRRFNLGDCFLWREETKPVVLNLGTQEGLGGASYLAVERALENMRRVADENQIKNIAMPRIGAGYGGLDWSRVRDLVEKVFGAWHGTVYVYEKFEK
jgi:O-acetyl-ADP-ribose deacetylase (regulator of RNase III)